MPSLASRLPLTAVLLIAAVGTVLKAVAPEAANDAVDPTGTGEERGTTFGFGFCCEKRQKWAEVRKTIYKG